MARSRSLGPLSRLQRGNSWPCTPLLGSQWRKWTPCSTTTSTRPRWLTGRPFQQHWRSHQPLLFSGPPPRGRHLVESGTAGWSSQPICLMWKPLHCLRFLSTAWGPCHCLGVPATAPCAGGSSPRKSSSPRATACSRGRASTLLPPSTIFMAQARYEGWRTLCSASCLPRTLLLERPAMDGSLPTCYIQQDFQEPVPRWASYVQQDLTWGQCTAGFGGFV